MTDNDSELWGSLGQKWWEQTGEECRATDQQIRFAAARHNGATRALAAELAGYSGDDVALRSAGSRADDTKSVQDMLVLAQAAEADLTDDPVTIAELKKKIGKIARGPDGTLALKACELIIKLEQTEMDRGESPDDDGFLWWRVARDWLQMPNGASAFMTMFKAHWRDMGHPANYPLLHDVHFLMQREPLGRQIWDWCCSNCGDDGRAELERQLANPDYQLKARMAIWKEIGKTPPAPAGNVISLSGAA